jgi:hypothetical protein
MVILFPSELSFHLFKANQYISYSVRWVNQLRIEMSIQLLNNNEAFVASYSK